VPAAPKKKRRPSARAQTPRRSRPTPLREYNRKRDFHRTAEPRGTAARSGGRSFVIQQHDATRMHYDFRLEHGGVLWSWAVPKGPSLDPADKRLAVQTEDHPVDYRDFEGHIPEGEYGGGPVIVWDRGTWEPEGDPDAGMRKGHLTFTIEGQKVRGRFDLVRLRGKVANGPKSNWLLIKRTDEHVRTGAEGRITEQLPHSVISGRTIDQPPAAVWRSKPTASASPPTVANRATKASRSAKTKKTKAVAAPVLSSIEPQLATLVDRAPPGPDWVYEVKFDGYRMLAAVEGKSAKLRSRNGLDWTQALSPIAAALQGLGVNRAVFDGELCHVNADGRTNFQKLQNAMPRGKADATMSRDLTYFMFDLLHLDGEDLRPLPLLERKARLQTVLAKCKWPLAYSSHLESDGRTAFLHACQSGLEGLIAKRTSAPYREGRGKDWLKLKCQKRQEFVIVGMIRASGTRLGFRSLVIATRDDKRLTYAGRVGTGFSQESLRELSQRLAKLVVKESPLDDPPRLSGVVWVRPELVCEIEYTEVTQDGSLRHPSFQGLREDKPARQVRRERAQPVEAVVDSDSASPRASKTPRGSAVEDDPQSVEGVRISHPERVIDQASGLTNLELARYHATVAPWLLPYAQNRPLALVRCPDGAAHQCFFQKHVMPGIGPDVVRGRAGKHEVLYVTNAAGLVELAQFNVIELHGWGATMEQPDRPDWFVLDLDPDSAVPFSRVVESALEIREALKSAGLRSWVKTTGGKGLHVCVPLAPRAQWAEVKEFTHAVARSLEAQHPQRYVATLSKAKRVGKIFIDYLRNGEGATAVLPYSPRARPGATVAMPVDWKDLAKVDPKEFTVKTAPVYLRRRRRDPWSDFLSSPQALPEL
jgi:bifunctional non-homologous end joining protein LigD